MHKIKNPYSWQGDCLNYRSIGCVILSKVEMKQLILYSKLAKNIMGSSSVPTWFLANGIFLMKSIIEYISRHLLL